MSHQAAASSASTNDITPGVLGFLVIAAMAVALFFLLRSMNKRLRRVRAVRDAGLAPGSELGAASGAASAGAGRGQPAASSAATGQTGTNGKHGAGSKAEADSADTPGSVNGGARGVPGGRPPG
jgi:hypothetical protein